MSSRVLVTWECDRCGALYETAEDAHPHGWRRITHGEVKGTYSTPGTMCADCDEEFRAWWRLPLQAQAAAELIDGSGGGDA